MLWGGKEDGRGDGKKILGGDWADGKRRLRDRGEGARAVGDLGDRVVGVMGFR